LDILTVSIPSYSISADGTTTYYTPNIAIDSEGTTAVVSSPYTNVVQVYKGFSSTNKTPTPTSIIGVNPGVNYGNSIAINASGTILATSAPNYNNNAGLVQYLYLSRINSANISYISNISTINTYNTYTNRIDSLFNVNNQTVLKETNISNVYVNTYNTSMYNISLGMNASLFRSYTNTSTTVINNNILTLGDDSSFTQVNIGGPNTNQIVLGTSTQTVVCPGKMNINAINSPITISNFITPTSRSHIGYIETSTITPGYIYDAVVGQNVEYYRYLILDVGVWMIIGHMAIGISDRNSFTRIQLGITKGEANTLEGTYSTGMNTDGAAAGTNGTVPIYYYRLQCTRVVVVNITDTERSYWLGALSVPNGTVSEVDLYAVRIA
jgi:hypothetical protein